VEGVGVVSLARCPGDFWLKKKVKLALPAAPPRRAARALRSYPPSHLRLQMVVARRPFLSHRPLLPA